MKSQVPATAVVGAFCGERVHADSRAVADFPVPNSRFHRFFATSALTTAGFLSPPLNRLLFHERGGRGPTSVSAAAKHFRRGLENLNLVGFWGRGGGGKAGQVMVQGERFYLARKREKNSASRLEKGTKIIYCNLGLEEELRKEKRFKNSERGAGWWRVVR